MATQASSAAKLRGALSLAGQLFDQGTARVHEFHRAISDVPLSTLPRAMGVDAGIKTTQMTHDTITDGVYAAVRAVGGVLFKTADAALKASERHGIISPAPATALAPANATRDNLVSAISGLIGDSMAQERNALAPKMGVHVRGHRISLKAETLATHFPQATGRIAIFAHGLCGNENTWAFYQEPGNPETQPYSERLHTDLAYTAVQLRYNTGLHISLNGRSAARQIEKLVAHWPVKVTEVVFIGHSMGGLLARSAIHAAMKANMQWTQQVRHVICLGSPHLGAPLERVVEKGVKSMQKLALSRPLAKVLDVRSVGIRDLGHGFIADEDWKGRERASLNADSRTPIPRLASAQYHFIGTTLGSGPESKINELIGDGLVQVSSSTAASLANADTAMLFSSNHMRLLNHPAIYAQIRQRLSGKALAAAV